MYFKINLKDIYVYNVQNQSNGQFNFIINKIQKTIIK